MDDAPNYGNTGAHHRPRTDPRLRRRRPPVRRQGQSERLVDEERSRRSSKSAPTALATSTRSYVVVDDIKINGKLTMGEDVADLGGDIAGLHRLEGRDRGQESEADRRPHARSALLHRHGAVGLRERAPRDCACARITDPHSPANTASMAWSSNMPEFAEAFRCKAGQPMVKPSEKACRVW